MVAKSPAFGGQSVPACQPTGILRAAVSGLLRIVSFRSGSFLLPLEGGLDFVSAAAQGWSGTAAPATAPLSGVDQLERRAVLSRTARGKRQGLSHRSRLLP